MKILIYGHARSGTTVLTGIVHSHQDLIGASYEPFKNGLNNGYWKIKDDPVIFPKALDEVYQEVDVIKCLMNEIPEINMPCLMQRPDKVILTYRRNMLRTVVSAHLARETNVWQARKADENYGDNFPSLDIGHLKWLMRFYRRGTKLARSVLSMHNVDHCELCYEDFFLSNDWKAQIKGLYDFLGVDMPTKSRNLGHLEWLMTKHRLNSERTYLKIPNVYEIERELGNRENGWLLEGGLHL